MYKLYLLLGAFLIAAWPVRADEVLWNEATDGDLYAYPNGSTFTIHPIGTTLSVIDTVEGTGTIVPNGGNFIDYPDAFSFVVPTGRELTDVSISISGDYPDSALTDLWASPTGAYDGTGSLGSSGGLLYSGSGTFDLFSSLRVSDLASGTYSMAIYPETTLRNGTLLPGPGTLTYSVAIETAVVPEPRTYLLVSGGLVLLLWRRIRQTRLG